jgi:ClpP class serine protease
MTQHPEQGLMAMLFGGGASYDQITQDFRAAMADDTVRAVLFDIDSPGGVTFGISELAQEVYKSRGRKPIVALANSTATSAAYWLGAAADKFYITPGGRAGSIGVFSMHLDMSEKAKAEFEPLTDEALQHGQSLVNAAYDTFIHDVARFRGTTEAKVRNGYGEGRFLDAKAAYAENMVDGIRTYDQALARIGEARSAPVEEEQQETAARMTFANEASSALAAVDAFVSRAKSLADLRAEDGRPLGETAKATLLAFLEDVKVDIQQAEAALVAGQPDARERLAKFRAIQAQVLREEMGVTA